MSPIKYFLAINTTSPELGLGLSNFREDFRCQTWNLGRELSTQLHQYLAEFIQPQTWQDFGAIAVAKGPGGFTGTRIGVVTARTLAQQLEIPLFSISTLAAVAWATVNPTKQNPQLLATEGKVISSEKSPRAIAVQMPAQRGELFVAIYAASDRAIEPLLADTVMAPETWEETLTQFDRGQSDRGHHLDRLVKMPPGSGALVGSLLEIAYLDWQDGKRPNWSDALPFYGQHPVL